MRRPSSVSTRWNACGIPLCVSRLCTSLERDDQRSPTTVIGPPPDTRPRDHSWTSSATVRWNSSSGERHGFST